MRQQSLLAVSLLLLIAAAVQADRPNILFILADDQAPWGYAASGYPQAVTPNMDRLAREGARFVNAFTPTPVCSPARASIMTSRYGTELGITDWINPRADKGLGLRADVPTWPLLLKGAGYSTGLIGKYHLGDEDEYHPTRRGYDSFMGFRGGGNPPINPTLEKEGVTSRHDGFIVDLVADEAIAFLRRHKDKTFALSLHFREPHAAYVPVPEQDWARVAHLTDPAIPNPDLPGLDVEKVKKLTRDYLASITALDRNIGRVLQTLDELKLAEKTLLICTSDHGYNMGHHGLQHKGNASWLLKQEFLPPATEHIPSGRRPNMFDTSVKIPLIIRWPGVIAPARVVEQTVSHLDWLPTFAAIAGAAVPKDAPIRGRDITPVLRDQLPSGAWSNDFYAEYSMKHGARTHMRMYRTPQWKLMRDFLSEGRDELYDLANDPGETRNLIREANPRIKAVITDLHQRMIDQMKRVDDPALPLALKR